MKKTKMLKKNYEFKNVLNRGKYYSGKYIAVFITRNSNQDINFLGIAINSKLGKANKRNYIKRLVREIYRQKEEKIKTGYNIVFIWRKKEKIEDANYVDIQKDIEKIFKEARIFLEE